MPLRINIVTSGRFHVLDLARELAAIGHDVRFYSCVPRGRAMRFGLPAPCHRRSLLWLAPLLAILVRTPRRLRPRIDALFMRLLDRAAAASMEGCDVFIGMSGLCVESARVARTRGAKVFLERGSRHILSQKQILEGMPAARPSFISASEVARELAGYALADVIVVPSTHSEQSFLEHGVPASRLFRNPYGVDLAMFVPTSKPSNRVPRVITVGAWSLRKGCDVLWQACERSGSWELLHVGPVGDAPLPSSPLFEHRDPVAQWDLPKQLAQADAFALASREEGLSLVQAQALACGLPVVCTDRTGGEDLRASLEDRRWVTVVPHDDVEALRAGVEAALSIARTQGGLRDALGAARHRLSWAAYGARYGAEIARRCLPS